MNKITFLLQIFCSFSDQKHIHDESLQVKVRVGSNFFFL